MITEPEIDRGSSSDPCPAGGRQNFNVRAASFQTALVNSSSIAGLSALPSLGSGQGSFPPLALPGLNGVGSEEARSIALALASVHRSSPGLTLNSWSVRWWNLKALI